MHQCGTPTEISRRLHKWFNRPLGQSLQVTEVHQLRDILPRLYGPIALQLAPVGNMNMLDASLAATRIMLEQSPADHASGPQVLGVPEALPFDTKSIHLVLLPHTLEFTDVPHQVLREVSRVLLPEGYAVVIGFNPFSLWGVWRLFARWRGGVPWCGRFLSLIRVKDWLALLGFEIMGGSMVYYRPPLWHDGLRDRLYFLEHVGARWWPMIGAVYIVVARKREPGMTPLQPEWKRKRSVVQGLAEPVVRAIRHEQS